MNKDAPKFSDTPRIAVQTYFHIEVVAASFARRLERELTAANIRAKRAIEVGRKLEKELSRYLEAPEPDGQYHDHDQRNKCHAIFRELWELEGES